MIKVTKQYDAQIKTEPAERTVSAILSTRRLDRDNEIVEPAGINYAEFLSKNPIMLWSHKYDEPGIGKCLDMHYDAGSDALLARAQFSDTQRGRELYGLVKAGVLNSFSIGFQSVVSGEATAEEKRNSPDYAKASKIIRAAELLEFSLVNIPSNPDATVVSKSYAISPDLIHELDLSGCKKSPVGVQSVYDVYDFR